MALRKISIVVGEKIGLLVVVKEVSPIDCKGYKKRMILCRCDCGKETEIRLEYLRNGHTKSCGCLKSIVSKMLNQTHGETNSRLYHVWASMKARCSYVGSKSFQYYGGKGVSVCEEWLSFETFRDWALSHGYKESLTIERDDNSKDYTPSNCRWVTKSAQARNKTNHRMITAQGKTKPLFYWAEHYGISPDTICSRIARGWLEEDAIFRPLDPRGRRNAGA